MKEVYDKIFELNGYCKSYYIDDEVKILIDAGVDFKKPVDFLILTHIHPDHIFYAKRIKERTNCKILIGKTDNFKETFKHFDTWENKKIHEFKIDGILLNNDEISSEKYNFKILSTKGHSPESICLYEPKHKILFSGDTIFENGYIGRTDFFQGNENELNESLEKLNELEITKLFAGH